METKTHNLSVSYDHTKHDDKHFFGGFLNLALNNIEDLIKVFSEKFNKQKEIPHPKTFVASCLGDTLADKDFQNRVAFLEKHLPVVKYLKPEANERSIFRNKLSLLLDGVYSLRNFYTHYYHDPLNISPDLLTLLNTVFTEVAKDVKTHKVKGEHTRHLLSKNLQKELTIRYNENLEELQELKKKLGDKGRRINLKDSKGIENKVLNGAFDHLIYKSKNGVFPRQYYQADYTLSEPAENGITISQSGLVFLLSMFLNRKETEDLKSRIRGFKAKIIKQGEEEISGLKYMATQWVFSYLSFRPIKQKITTDFDKESLLIQIIDELSKVPDEVYRTFDNQTQKRFIEDINEYLKQGNADGTLNDSIVVHSVIRKRYENKFNYFAIRFLDEFINFPSLRFQIHLGNYVHDRRLKNIKGTSFETERVVKERIKVFGKLSEVTGLKSSHVAKLLDKPADTGWEIFPNPSYSFIENNIPIFLSMDKEFKSDVTTFKKERALEKPQERMKRREDKNAKYQIVQEIEKNKAVINYEEPIAQLSLNELPALLYDILINGVSPEEVEAKLKRKINEHFELTKSYDPTSPLPASKISRRLRHNTTGSLDGSKIIQLLQKEMDFSNQKLDELRKNRSDLNKRVDGKILRKFVFKFSEIGQEATTLANDIKRFMPPAVREEWKGYQHSQMQQSLAFFDKRPSEAFDILKQVWNFDMDQFPWEEWIVNSFNNSNSFEKFYERYYKGRKQYFDNLQTELSHWINNGENLQDFINQHLPIKFLEKRLYILEPLDVEKRKILSKPLVLPRGLFDEKPTFIKGKKVTECPSEYANWYQYTYDDKHEFQKFYTWKRDYKDLLLQEKQRDEDFINNTKALNTNQQLELLKMKQDLLIKKIKTQDLFLKLIAQYLFHNVFGYTLDISLKDLYLTQKERLEKEHLAVVQSQKKAGDKSPNIVNDNFIWSKTVPFSTQQLLETDVMLKDFGKFKHILSGEKTIALFSYNPDKKWHINELMQELYTGKYSYETIRREELLKEIQLLEKEILTAWSFKPGDNHPVELGAIPNFKCYMAKGVLQLAPHLCEAEDAWWLENLNEDDFERLEEKDFAHKTELTQLAFFLTLIRNKFAHNQLPAKQFYDFIQKKYPDIKGETVSHFYLNIVKHHKTRLKEITG